MSELFYSIDPWAAAWNFRLWNASWQGALAIALAWGIARWCTFLSPRVICWVWRLACLKLLVSLVWLAPVLIPLLPAPAMVADAAPDAAIAPSPWNAQLEVPHDGQRVEVQPARPQPILSLGGMIAFCWVIGVACSIALTTRQWNVARRLRSSAGAAEQRIEGLLRAEARLVRTLRLPQLLASSQINSPILVGVIRPAILLPTGAGQAFSEEELRLMLAHEFAHFKRRDLAWNWLPTVVGWLFFFHPLVWLMKRSWSEAQEAACDELVLESHRDDSSQYGRLLLKLATAWPGDQRNSLVAAGVLGAYRNLERRFLAIARVRPRSFVQLAVAAAVLAIISLPGLVPWRLVAQESGAKPAQIAARADKSQRKSAGQRPEAKITGAAITGTFQPNSTPVADTMPPSEAHIKAAAAIEKLGGNIGRHSPSGWLVVLMREWKGTDRDFALLFELDDLKGIVVEDCGKLLADNFAALKRLKGPLFLQLTQPSNEQIQALRGAENISSLSLLGNSFTDASLESAAMLPNLSSFMVAGRSAIGQGPESTITDAGLAQLAKCKKLRLFSVNDCPQVSGVTMNAFAQSNELQAVNLIQLPVSDEGMAALTELTQVKRMQLWTNEVSQAGYTSLAKLTGLVQLAMLKAAQFDDEAAAAIAGLQQLQVLMIQGGSLTDAGLTHFAPLTNLYGLDIHQGSFSDVGLGYLKRLVELRRLELSGPSTFTDNGLKNLSGMTRLKQLSLSSKSITDAGIGALSELPNLESLNLSGSGISGSGIGELSKLTKLRALSLSNSPIRDDELENFAKLPVLEVLNLDNTAVTDLGMAALAKSPKLRTLQLHGDKITGKGLEALGNLKTLRSLRVDSAADTLELREQLKKKNPQLSINDFLLSFSFGLGGRDAEFLELDNDSVPIP